MSKSDSLWIVEDYKDGSLIGIYATEEIAMSVANQNIERSTVPRKVLIDNHGKLIELSATTCQWVETNGTTSPIWKDPDTGEIHYDSAWEDMCVAKKKARSMCEGFAEKKWWQFWKPRQ